MKNINKHLILRRISNFHGMAYFSSTKKTSFKDIKLKIDLSTKYDVINNTTFPRMKTELKLTTAYGKYKIDMEKEVVILDNSSTSKDFVVLSDIFKDKYKGMIERGIKSFASVCQAKSSSNRKILKDYEDGKINLSDFHMKELRIEIEDYEQLAEKLQNEKTVEIILKNCEQIIKKIYSEME